MGTDTNGLKNTAELAKYLDIATTEITSIRDPTHDIISSYNELMFRKQVNSPLVDTADGTPITV